jgi:hypothetical protein
MTDIRSLVRFGGSHHPIIAYALVRQTYELQKPFNDQPSVVSAAR